MKEPEQLSGLVSVAHQTDKGVMPSVVHAWAGHGEGGLYIDGKKVSGYYTCGEAAIVEALGFNPEMRHLDEKWFASIVDLPENLNECVMNQPFSKRSVG